MYVHRKRVILLFRVLCLVIFLIIHCKIKNKLISSNNNVMLRANLSFTLVHIIINTILTSPSLSNIIIRQLFFTVYICTFLHRVLRRRNFYIHGARWLTKRLTGNLFLAHFPYVDSIGLDKLVYLSSVNEYSNEVQRKQ